MEEEEEYIDHKIHLVLQLGGIDGPSVFEIRLAMCLVSHSGT